MNLNNIIEHIKFYDDCSVVDKYLSYGGDVNGKDYNGQTLLLLAVQNDMSKVARFLIEKGADMNVEYNQENILTLAIRNENMDMNMSY